MAGWRPQNYRGRLQKDDKADFNLFPILEEGVLKLFEKRESMLTAFSPTAYSYAMKQKKKISKSMLV